VRFAVDTGIALSLASIAPAIPSRCALEVVDAETGNCPACPVNAGPRMLLMMMATPR
jgi:hypothetical protein